MIINDVIDNEKLNNYEFDSNELTKVVNTKHKTNNPINWKQVRARVKKLALFPKGFYNPTVIDFEQQLWNIVLSVRNQHKTTGFVLIGMVLYWMYGFRLEYFRLTADDCRPKDHIHFFDSIKDLGYIEKITDGVYNGCDYKAGFWYFTYTDDDGNITYDDNPFMHVFPIRKAMDLKSNYTSNSRFIIFDEFIDNTKLYKDDFILLCDCIATIFRDGDGYRDGWVNLLANTIDKQSVWFNELNIQRDIANMKQGECKRISNGECTPVLVSILEPKITETRKKSIVKLFNFLNPKLSAITGNDDGWAVRIYPRLPKGYNTYLARNIYVNCNGFLVRCDIINNSVVGVAINVVETPKNATPDDAIELTLNPPTKSNQVYGFNNNKLAKVFKYCFNANTIYYGSNHAGVTFDSFINQLK